MLKNLEKTSLFYLISYHYAQCSIQNRQKSIICFQTTLNFLAQQIKKCVELKMVLKAVKESQYKNSKGDNI